MKRMEAIKIMSKLALYLLVGLFGLVTHLDGLYSWGKKKTSELSGEGR